jgi:hypothetical protein
VGFVRFVPGAALPEAQQLFVNAIDAEAGSVDEANGLEHISQKRIPANRRMAKDVLRSHSSDKPSRAGNRDPVAMNLDLNRLLEGGERAR